MLASAGLAQVELVLHRGGMSSKRRLYAQMKLQAMSADQGQMTASNALARIVAVRQVSGLSERRASVWGAQEVIERAQQVAQPKVPKGDRDAGDEACREHSAL
jgi:hypothetical protein